MSILWQAYADNGEQIPDKGYTRDEALEGRLHAASHIWVWQKDSEGTKILLQKRSDTQYTWPGYLDISAAGHIDIGETPLQAAVRETNEELGIVIKPEELNLLFVYRAKMIADNDKKKIEHEFQWVYGLELDHQPEIALLDGEVSGTEWLSIEELQQLIDKKSQQQIVPHGDKYFSQLLAFIRS